MPRNQLMTVLAAGTLLGLIASLQGVINAKMAGRLDWLDPLLAHLPYWLSWAALAPVIWWARPEALARPTGRIGWAAWHVTAAVVLMLLQSAALYGWQRFAGLTDLTVPTWQTAVGIGYVRLIPNTLIYALLLACVYSAAKGSAAPGVAPDVATGSPKPLGCLTIKHDGRLTVLPVGEIDWIEAANYYARLHTRGHSILIRESMASLESRLDPAAFCRVHRSVIVNLDRVKEIRTAKKGEHTIVVAGGGKLPVNRSRKKRLENALAHQK